MSGGSLNYAYEHVENAASDIASHAKSPEHAAFAKHLLKVAKALHDTEWAWSGDTSEGSEIEAIMRVIRSEDVAVQAAEELLLAADKAVAAAEKLHGSLCAQQAERAEMLEAFEDCFQWLCAHAQGLGSREELECSERYKRIRQVIESVRARESRATRRNARAPQDGESQEASFA